MELNNDISCPICNREFSKNQIEEHANKCIFLTSNRNIAVKRDAQFPMFTSPVSHKKLKTEPAVQSTSEIAHVIEKKTYDILNKVDIASASSNSIPLAEQMRPNSLDEYIGQTHILGNDKFLKQLLLKKTIPSMILWGPPGCGKTSLANVISSICKGDNELRFVKLSATMSGINDVKEVVKVAKNETKFKRKTILFMDEIHRFNKLQQDTFLPNIENGTIILIGATTENPSFSLNSALLSRCRVIILEKLTIENLLSILRKAVVTKFNGIVVEDGQKNPDSSSLKVFPNILVEEKSLKWLSEISDGDARIALSSLQLAVQMKIPEDALLSGPGLITLDDIKSGIKKSHLLYDRKGEEHYNIISAMHKSIRASDDSAALYWMTRMLEGGEDPLYIARRLVRIAGEDIGLANPKALNLAVSCMQACQLIGMPECDVILAECAVYLARSDKSTEVYHALLETKRNISEHKGPLPSVPLHLRNASTTLMKNIGYGKDYNTRHKDESNLTYMPEGMEDVCFFQS